MQMKKHKIIKSPYLTGWKESCKMSNLIPAKLKVHLWILSSINAKRPWMLYSTNLSYTYPHTDTSSQTTVLAALQHPWRNLEFSALFKGTLELFCEEPPFSAESSLSHKLFFRRDGAECWQESVLAFLRFSALFKGTLTGKRQLVIQCTNESIHNVCVIRGRWLNGV